MHQNAPRSSIYLEKSKNKGGYSDQSYNLENIQKQSAWRRYYFKLLNLMQEYNVVTQQIYCIFLVIEFLEMLSFLFLQFTVSVSEQYGNTGIYSYIKLFKPSYYLNYLGVQQGFKIEQQYMLYIPVAVVCSLLTIDFICIIIISKKCKDGYHILFTGPALKSIIQFISIYQVLILKVLMIPFLMILLAPVICERKELDDGTHISINQHYKYQCWTASHIVVSVTSLTFAAILIVSVILQALIYHHQRVQSNLPWAGAISKAELLKTLIKITIIMYFVLEPYSMWINIMSKVINVLLVLLLIYQRYYIFFHTNKNVFMVTLIQEASYVWLTISMTFLNIIDKEINMFTFIYVITSLIFFNMFVVMYFLKKDSTISLTNFPNITRSSDYIWFFLQLKRVFHFNEEKLIERTVLLGLLKNHIPTCLSEQCTCKKIYSSIFCKDKGSHYEVKADLDQIATKHSLGDQDEGEYGFEQKKNKKEEISTTSEKRRSYQKDLFRFFIQMVEDVLAKNPKNQGLEFIHVATSQEKLNKVFKCYFEIIKMQKNKPTIEWDYFLYQMKQQLETLMYKKYLKNLNDRQQSINILKVQDFQRLFVKFEEQVKGTADNCLGFWKELLDKKLDVNRIHDFGVQVSNSYTDVSGITRDMLSLYPDNLLLLKIYSFFLSNVMNNGFEANEYNMRAKSVLQNLNNLQRNSLDEEKYLGNNTPTAIITMTVTTKDIGNITHSNFETKSLLGYQNKELRGKNVRILMPKLLGDNHDQFIKNYFETAKAHILEKQRLVFAKTKDGYVIPVCILVKAIPKLTQSLTFVGFIRRIEPTHSFLQIPTQFTGQEYHIILTNQEGQIYGFTQNCWETFGFKPNFFFDKFGDPDVNIKIEKIIRNLQNKTFHNKLIASKDGAFCSLDTGEVIDNISKELLTRSEQSVLQNISGSYNINVQLQEMSFYNGTIIMNIYKILKMSRIIRSQNVLDMIYVKMYEQYDSSNVDDESNVDSNNLLLTKGKSQESGEYEDDIVIPPKLDQNNGTNFSLNEIANRQNETKYLQDFKKSISDQEIPPQLLKLNRVVHTLIILILIICSFEFYVSSGFIQYGKLLIKNQEDLYQKQVYVSQIGTNLVTIALINQGLQSNRVQNFTNRSDILYSYLKQDIIDLKQCEQDIQDINLKYNVFEMKTYDPNPTINLQAIDQYGKIYVQEQPMFFSLQQYMSGLQNLLYVTNMTQFKLLPPLYNLGTNLTSNTTYNLTQTQQSIYFIIQNSLLNLNAISGQQIEDFRDSIFQMIKINSLITYVIFAFLVTIIILSGIIIFPIVVGVQKNKVMILSIYFELSPQEIEQVFIKCLKFISTIEDRFDNQGDELEYGGVMNNSPKYQYLKGQLQSVNNNQLMNQLEPVQQNNESIIDHNLSVSFSERGTNRMLLQEQMDGVEISRQKNSQKKILQDKIVKNNDSSISAGSSKDSSSQSFTDIIDTIKNKNKKIDQQNVFKQIKLKSSKINVLTIAGLLVFLAYFVLTFSTNIYEINRIKVFLGYTDDLFSSRIDMQNIHFAFLQDVMRNQYINYTDRNEVDVFDDYLRKFYDLQDTQLQLLRKINTVEFLKGAAIEYIVKIFSDKFCDTIANNIPTVEQQIQCEFIDQGELTFGFKQSKYNFLYSQQNLQILFDKNRNNIPALKQLLNNDQLLSYSMKSNIYYRAYFTTLLQVVKDSCQKHYNQIILYYELMFAVFILGSLFVLLYLWRKFLINIWDEVKRSKGMLNMIPVEFLERDSNISKLSMKKLSRHH